MQLLTRLLVFNNARALFNFIVDMDDRMNGAGDAFPPLITHQIQYGL